VRIHLAGEHALEFERLDVALERRRVSLDLADCAGFAFRFGEF
jgi:hypothetical protein